MENVLIFAPLYSPYSGGSPTYFSELVDGLPTKYEIYILTAYHPNKPLYVEEEGAHIYRVIPRKDNWPAPARMMLEGTIGFIVAILLGLFYRIEIAHIHSTSFSTPPIAVAMKILSTPTIYDCRDEGIRPWIVTLGNPIAYFSVSRRVDDILVNAGVDRNSIIRVPVTNPPYTSEYASLPDDSDDSFSAIFVGTLRELKGADMLLDSFLDFAETRHDTTLTFVGDGPLRDQLSDDIHTSNINHRIELLGDISHREALAEIASADVLILPSASEGRPRVVLEALAVGTPVIATRVGMIPEEINDEKTGLLIERSQKSVIEALETMYNNPQLRREMAMNALEKSSDSARDELIDAVEQGYSRIKYT